MSPEEKRLKALEATKQWQAANPEKMALAKTKSKARRNNPEAKAKALEATRQWRGANPEKMAEQKVKAQQIRHEARRAADRAYVAECEARSAASLTPLWRPFPNTPSLTLKSLREGQPWDVAQGKFPLGANKL